MNKTIFTIGILALVLSAALFLFGLDFFGGMIGRVQVSVYLGWFFALLGGLLVLTSLWKRWAN